MRILDGLWFENHVIERHELPCIRRLIARPKRDKGIKVFVGRLAPPVERRRSQGDHLFFHPAGARSDGQTPVGEYIQRREYFGRLDRRSIRQHHDGGEQSDSFGNRRNVGECRELFETRPGVGSGPDSGRVLGVLGVDLARDNDMVADAEICKAQRLAMACDGGNAVWIIGGTARADMDPEIHTLILSL